MPISYVERIVLQYGVSLMSNPFIMGIFLCWRSPSKWVYFCAEEVLQSGYIFVLKKSFKVGIFFNPQHTHPGKLGMKSHPPSPRAELPTRPKENGHFHWRIRRCGAGGGGGQRAITSSCKYFFFSFYTISSHPIELLEIGLSKTARKNGDSYVSTCDNCIYTIYIFFLFYLHLI